MGGGRHQTCTFLKKTIAPRHVTNEWKIPLLSVSTLSCRTAQVNAKPDILASALSSLEIEAVFMTERDCVSIPSFDECSVASRWSCDKATDTTPCKVPRKLSVLYIERSCEILETVYNAFNHPVTKDL